MFTIYKGSSLLSNDIYFQVHHVSQFVCLGDFLSKKSLTSHRVDQITNIIYHNRMCVKGCEGLAYNYVTASKITLRQILIK